MDFGGIYKVLEASPNHELSFKDVRNNIGGDRTRLQWAEYIEKAVEASNGALWKNGTRMGLIKGNAASFQVPVKPARAPKLSIPATRPSAVAPPIAAAGASPTPAPSKRVSSSGVLGHDIYRILESSPGQELTFKEVRSTLGGDRTRLQWSEYIAETVAASEGGLWKDDKRIKLVGSRPVAKPPAGSQSKQPSAEAAVAGEGAASTCKERRKAKRLAEQLEAAEKKKKKLKKEPQSKTGADGVRYCDRSSFVCAGACGKDLPPSAFKPNQIKKGEGKHRCTACVDEAEIAASQAAATLAEAKQAELKRKRAADSKGNHSSSAEVIAQDLWYAHLEPSAVVAAASAAAAAGSAAKAQPMRPEVALLRLKRTKLLRSQFARSLKEHHATRTPLMAFERWLARSKLHETHPSYDEGVGDSDTSSGGGSSKKKAGIFAHVPGTVPAALVRDELLPSDENFVDIGLVRDLLRVGLSEEAAHSVASSLAVASKKACEALKEASEIAKREARQRQQQAAWGALEEDERKKGDKEEEAAGDDSSSSSSSSSSSDEEEDNDEDSTRRPAKVSASSEMDASSKKNDSTNSSGNLIACSLAGRATYKLAMGTVKPYLEVKQAHLAKLAMLHERTLVNGGSSSTDKASAATSESAEAILERLLANDSEAAAAAAKGSADPVATMAAQSPFLPRVFALLSGYEALAGHGYQAACTPQSFQLLHEKLGVECECFASPLNARFGNYCSALPSLDAPFGSLGSFFDFFPLEGSFEANPPFVPEVMSAMITHMEALLTSAQAKNKALSFVVVVPHWPAVKAWQALQSSSFKQANGFNIEATEHGFVDGAQHLGGRDQYRPSSFGTTVALLQTTAAAERWPFTAELASELKLAMRLPDGGPTLEEWEKRGPAKGGSAKNGGAVATTTTTTSTADAVTALGSGKGSKGDIGKGGKGSKGSGKGKGKGKGKGAR